MNWMPIETAPKDGIKILVTHWSTQKRHWGTNIVKWDISGTRPWWIGAYYNSEFTHWMPLPDPPMMDKE